MSDLISREAAIETLIKPQRNETHDDYWEGKVAQYNFDVIALQQMPSAQPERLTDDDFETIRIHLNAHKEELCNQGRWQEAKEYQRILDRFMAFASAEPEIIRCKDCQNWDTSWQNDFAQLYHYCPMVDGTRKDDWYCADAERRGEQE